MTGASLVLILIVLFMVGVALIEYVNGREDGR